MYEIYLHKKRKNINVVKKNKKVSKKIIIYS